MTVYCEEMTNKICHRIAQGRSLLSVCNELNISTNTVYSWLKDKDKQEFHAKYARARELQSHIFADEIVEIADNEGIAVDSRRVRIDARKWHAGKNNSKYADKSSLDVNHKGAVAVVTVDMPKLGELIDQAAVGTKDSAMAGDDAMRSVLPDPLRDGA